MSNPFFSIIIPSFNSAATLYDCIESIVAQSFCNWEVLIVDSLSKDDTVKIAASFAAEFSSVKIISEKDKGIYDAMNKGIYLSKGKWLYFMGCDDKLYNNEVLKNIADAIVETPEIEIVYGNVFSERFNGLYDGKFNFSKILKKNISHQAIFFNKDVFNKTGFFDLKYKAHSDWDHNMKWILSDNIKNRYLEITVACYADGGFSSLHGDAVFYNDLLENYFRYGKNTLPFWKKLEVYFFEFLKSIKRRDLKRFTRVIKSL